MRGRGPASTAKKTSRSDLEVKADDLERRLKEKIEVMTGFAEPEVRARKLEQCFKYFDSNGSGNIDYTEFFAAMTKFNFVGVQKETETLFNRYDDDASGEIDYKEFSYHIFGLGEKPALDVNARNIVEKVKARILAKDGASGVHNVTRILRRMDTDGSKSLDQTELMNGLREYGINRIPPSEMQILFNHFDRDRSGKVSVDEFMRGLKVRRLLSTYDMFLIGSFP
jgi:Ca2+-binding EF-hand superfamily protein